MTGHVLLLDFGATRIKSAKLNTGNGQLGKIYNTKGSASIGSRVVADFFATSVQEHVSVAQTNDPIAAVIICAEMHGFFIQDCQSGALSDYFSWRHSSGGDQKIATDLNSSGFLGKTGFAARPGLPIVNILGSEDKWIKGGEKQIAFIPDGICRMLGRSENVVHASLGHSSGFYGSDNLPLVGFDIPSLTLPKLACINMPLIGEIEVEGRTLPVYGGYGDLQASILGVNPKDDQWVVNIGTGSQLAIVSQKVLPNLEERKYFDDKILSCISHIPAGRALNVFANLFQEIREELDPGYFWRLLQNAEEPSNNPKIPAFNLAVFPQARGFQNGGNIDFIYERDFNLQNFSYGLINSLAKQYSELIQLSGNISDKPVVLAGKFVSEIPLFKTCFEANSMMPTESNFKQEDPSIIGLKRLVENDTRWLTT